MDLSITADISESVHDVPANIDNLMQFIKDLISDNDVDSGNVQVSLTLFHHNVFNEFFFNTYNSTSQILRHIDYNVHITWGATNTGDALKNLYHEVFKHHNGDRHDAVDVAMIITDGRSNDNAYTVEQATKVHDHGIHTIAVGIGLSDLSELRQIASSDEDMFYVDTFQQLGSARHAIEKLFVDKCSGKKFHYPDFINVCHHMCITKLELAA